MRVTHVITRLIVGGAQENTVASVLGLRQKANLELSLVSGPTLGREGSLEPLLADYPYLLTIVPDLVRPVHPWKDWLALRQLTRLFRERRPDIVHTHSSKAGILGRLAAARAGVPIIVHTIHGPSFGSFQGPLANSVFRFAERYTAKVTSHFVVVADAMKRQYLSAGIGEPENYTTVLSGFPMDPFLSARNDLELRASLGITADEIIVGKIARLVPLKGYEDLIAVAPAVVRSCSQVKFLLVGDGPWREPLRTAGEFTRFERPFCLHRPGLAARSAAVGWNYGHSGAFVGARRTPTRAAASVGGQPAHRRLRLRWRQRSLP